MSNNSILEVNNLTKKYESFTLGPISFTIGPGEIVGFIGRNGAGKTTTMKSIYGLVHNDSGSVAIFSKNFAENELELKERIGFMLGGVDYYPRTKLKNLTAVIKRFYNNWDEETYQKYMNEFKLDYNKRVNELSEGMKVKYNLAISLSHHAELLILDEPTSGLDPVSRDEVTDIFMHLTENKKTSILFSTHITEDLDKCADRIIYIRKGKIVADQELNIFKDSYVLLKGNKENIAEETLKRAVGYRETRSGFEALFKQGEIAENSDLTFTKPDLETIMVLSERGEENV